MKDQPHHGGSPRALELRRKLGLQHLNIEAGHFALHGKSDLSVNVDGASMAASNVIYLMPPYVITPEQIQQVCQVAAEGIDIATA